MTTTEIPKSDWAEFFDAFSRTHRGWLVSTDIMSPDMGDQVQVHDLPFLGLDYDPGRKGTPEIELMAGSVPGAHLTRRIVNPSQVWLKTDDKSADALEITTSANSILIQFKVAEEPELTNGSGDAG